MRHQLSTIATVFAFALTSSASGPASWPVDQQSAAGRSAASIAQLPAPEGHSSGRGHHVPGPGAYTAGSATWVDVEDGHILIGRRQEVVWRSSESYPIGSATDSVTAVLVGVPGVAFQIEGRDNLYVAAGHGPERSVARGEWPEAWTASGDLITIQAGTERGHDWAIVLRGVDGRLVRTLAERLSGAALDHRFVDSSGWFWFWTARGDLVRTDGVRDVKVTNHRALRFRHPPYVYATTDDLILLYSDGWRVVVLQRNGAFFAQASAPTDGSVAGFGDSLMASPDGRVVIYALFEVDAPRTTTIFALHQGDKSGRPIFRTRGAEWACAPPPVHWMNDRWLLFQYPDGHFAAIDTLGEHRPRRMESDAGVGRVARTSAG